MATDLTYSHGEIQRYLRKEMSPAEMHAFEKQMMNDPFLADALEGFQQSNANIATQHLAEIKDEISPKKEQAKIIGFGSTKWMRIAAIFLVVIGAGIITYNLFDKEESTELATVTQSQNIEVDSITATEETMAQAQGLPGKTANDNTQQTSPMIKEVPPTTEASSGVPLAMRQTPIDSSSLALMDTSTKDQAALLDEVVVNAARAPRVVSKEMMSKKTASTQPQEGWVNFQAYVDIEVSKAKEKNPSYANNQVELEFAIDKDGHATDIKILKASNTEVAKVAVEILRKSPRWTASANNAKARIVINF